MAWLLLFFIYIQTYLFFSLFRQAITVQSHDPRRGHGLHGEPAPASRRRILHRVISPAPTEPRCTAQIVSTDLKVYIFDNTNTAINNTGTGLADRFRPGNYQAADAIMYLHPPPHFFFFFGCFSRTRSTAAAQASWIVLFDL